MGRRPRRQSTIPNTASAQENSAEETPLQRSESFTSAAAAERHSQPDLDHVLDVLDQLRRALKRLDTKRQVGGLCK